MKILKLGIISLVVFALMITGISLFFPSRVRISKAIDINATKDSILQQLSDPVKWKNWYPGTDSADYLIVEGKIQGFITGEMQGLMIKSVTDSSVIAGNVGKNFKKGEQGWILYNASQPNTITVQWYMDIYLKWYPWEKFSSLLLEKRYGPMLEKGLENLKYLLEK
jgi:hypothetical protein